MSTPDLSAIEKIKPDLPTLAGVMLAGEQITADDGRFWAEMLEIAELLGVAPQDLVDAVVAARHA